jgi:hypothetical protein
MKMCKRCGSVDSSVKKVVQSGLTSKLRVMKSPSFLSFLRMLERTRPRTVGLTLPRRALGTRGSNLFGNFDSGTLDSNVPKVAGIAKESGA